MTKAELSQLYYLNREIEREMKRLAELRAAATSTVARITGLPHMGQAADKTALAAEIADCQTVIDTKVQLAMIEYNRLNRYIAGVDDSLARQILMLRYVEGLSWRQVAESVGGGNTEDSVRKACQRFLERG